MKGKAKASVNQPKVISEYTKGMGGANLLDMLLGSYRPNLHSKKWWWPLFSNALNIAVVAGFKIHKNVYTDQLSHLDFCDEVAEVIVRANHEAQRVRLGGPTASVPDKIRLDGINHTLVPASQDRCIYCKSITRLMCSKCDERLQEKFAMNCIIRNKTFRSKFSLSLMNSWIFWVLTTVYLLHVLS